MPTPIRAALTLTVLTALSQALQGAPPPSAVRWTRWEMTLAGSGLLSAVFTGPSGEKIEAPAFPSGAGAFKVRVAFPAAGIWNWRTVCSDQASALRGRRGSVRVKEYAGSNPLYRHGFLKVHSGGRYLVHADGTPFLWMGDTPWYASLNGTAQEWQDYLADRAVKRFSVVQVTSIRGPAKPHVRAPFDAHGDPDPVYWDSLDEKVKRANDYGIVVLIVGLGRPSNLAYEKFVARPEFARHVAARFFGDHVIFSPNFDGVYKPIYDTVAENLRAATAIHLITQHPNTQRGQTEVYVPKPYLSFSGLQSGHHDGKLESTYGAARQWPLDLWAMTPVRPIINIEGMYDGRGNNEGNGWREKDVRRIGWISWLSGALGYTYAAGETDRKVRGSKGGVWGWNQDEAAWDYWRKAIAWPSSRQMTVLRDFFASLEWWRLEPAPAMVVEGGAINQERAVCASAADRSFAVAYSPVRQKLVLDMAQFPGSVKATWIDPLSGRTEEIAAPIPNRATYSFTMPASGEDWALLLRSVPEGKTP